MARIGIVGSGVAGLGAAYRLAPHAQVTLFEAEDRFGGHAHTVDVTLDGHTHAVDIAFLSFNLRSYPLLIALFEEFGIEVTPAPLTFSARLADDDLEWRGPSLNGLFAQRRNILSPRFWRMLRRRRALQSTGHGAGDQRWPSEMAQTIGDFPPAQLRHTLPRRLPPSHREQPVAVPRRTGHSNFHRDTDQLLPQPGPHRHELAPAMVQRAQAARIATSRRSSPQCARRRTRRFRGLPSCP